VTDLLTPTTRREPALGPGQLVDGTGPDWAVVRELRTAVASELSDRLRGHPDMSRDSQRELARALTTRAVADWVDQQATGGALTPTVAEEARIADAVLAAIFGLGRIQPLVDDPTVENIDIAGCDQVWLEYADGRIEPGPAVADSDAALVETLQSFATYLGQILHRSPDVALEAARRQPADRDHGGHSAPGSPHPPASAPRRHVGPARRVGHR
jgi:pilus assembly protein CpaF